MVKLKEVINENAIISPFKTLRQLILSGGLVVGITVCCLLPSVYFLVLPAIDKSVCLPNLAKKLGTTPTPLAMFQFARRVVKPGMSREETNAALAQLGQVKEGTRRTISNGDEEVSLAINDCLYWPNNLWIYADYSLDGKLLYIVFNNGSP